MHIFAYVLTSLTNCFTDYEQKTVYDAIAVTLANYCALYIVVLL